MEKNQRQPSPHDRNQRARPSKAYAEYSGLAIQMALVIGLGVWAGVKLDDRLSMRFPAFTVGLSLFAVIIAMVMVILKVTHSK